MVTVSLVAVASSIIISIIISTCHGLDGQLKKYVFNNNGLGTYSFDELEECIYSYNAFCPIYLTLEPYETQDGTYRREDGGIANSADGLVVRGEYGYIDPSGRPFALRYIADANGFQPLLEDDTRFNDRRIY